MHHALEIQEILANIFRYCHDSVGDDTPYGDLSSLATTCRAFKEPALDALWQELDDIMPLVRCLPEASQQISSTEYSFHRPLTRTEWDVIRRYARRIRSIRVLFDGLDENSLSILSNPPTTEPLFPSLRSLTCTFPIDVALSHFLLPSLLSAVFMTDGTHINTPSMNGFIQSFSQLCPNLRMVQFRVLAPCDTTPSAGAISDCIRGWQNLEDMHMKVPLDAVAIVHLSCISGLTRLRFTLDEPLSHFDSPLVFSNLQELGLWSKSLSSVSQFLSRVRLPMVAQLTATTTNHPSRPELFSFFTSVQTSGAGWAIHEIRLGESLSANVHLSPQLLRLDDLRSCMAFSNLHRIDLDTQWSVGLTDSDLLTLTSAWPCLEKLWINHSRGWNTTHGITPRGLLQLLQTCPSLHDIALVMNTRGDVELAPSPESLGPTLPRPFTLGVLDSFIDEDSVMSLVTFFTRVASLPGFDLYAGSWNGIWRRSDQEAYMRRWNNVRQRATVGMKCN